MMGRVIVDDLLTRLAGLPSSVNRDAYFAFVSAVGDAALRRDGGPQHITGSCFVFSPDLQHVLLCFHRKGRFWVQFGGHIEPLDATVAATAQREAREESGITDLVLISDSIVDLDRHDLTGGFACDAHWDVGFVALTSMDAELAVSDESEDVRWFSVRALPSAVPDGFETRLAKVLTGICR